MMSMYMQHFTWGEWLDGLSRQEFVDPARPNKAQYIAAVPPADVEMTDAEKAGRWVRRCVRCSR